jgi:hypothetical protein
MSKTIVIQPGGYHPYHAGHHALYQSAQRTFPDAEVFVAATNDTSSRPFPFAVKEKLAKLAGVEAGHFVQVKSPFRAEEITSRFDPERDVLIFVRSEKDAGSPPQPGGIKKDGSPSYLQPLLGAEKLEPFSKHAYMAYLPTVEFGPGMTSATQIRTAWPTLNEKRKTALVMSLYPAAQKNPKLAQTVVKLLDAAIGTEAVAEGFEQTWAVTGTWTHRKYQRDPHTTTTKVVADSPEEAMRKYKSHMWNEYERRVLDMKVKPYTGQAATAVTIDEQGGEEGTTVAQPGQRVTIITPPKMIDVLPGDTYFVRTSDAEGVTLNHSLGTRYDNVKFPHGTYKIVKKQGVAEVSLNEFAPGDGDDGENPLDDYPCYDCGSTIYMHHTRLCDLAEPDAVRDLLAEPGTQHWTGRVPKGLKPIPGLSKGVEETVSANGTIANTSGAGAGMTASYQRRDNQPIDEDYLDERRL